MPAGVQLPLAQVAQQGRRRCVLAQGEVAQAQLGEPLGDGLLHLGEVMDVRPGHGDVGPRPRPLGARPGGADCHAVGVPRPGVLEHVGEAVAAQQPLIGQVNALDGL